MKERLHTVRWAYWAVLLVGLAGLIVAWPTARDAQLTAALHELARMEQAFDQPALERRLTEQVTQQVSVPLASVTDAIRSRAIGPVRVAEGLPPLQGRGTVRVERLGQLAAMADAPPAIPTTIPEHTAMVPALRWRLVRANNARGFELRDLRWSPAALDADVVAAEDAVEAAQARFAEAQAAHARAERAHQRASRVYEFRRGARLKPKLVREAADKLTAAQHAFQEQEATLKAARERYQTLAATADRVVLDDQPASHLDGAKYAAIEATLWPLPAGPELILRFGVPLSHSTAQLTPLTHVELTATRQDALWPTLSERSLTDAMAHLHAELSWHQRGTLALQLLPLAPLLFLILLALSCRRARKSYNPFTGGGPLPTVGLGRFRRTCGTLCVVPLAPSVAATVALFGLGVRPVVAMPLGLLSLATALWACLEVYKLTILREDVERTSLPPATLARVES